MPLEQRLLKEEFIDGDFTTVMVCIDVYSCEELVSISKYIKMRIFKSYEGIDPRYLTKRMGSRD